MAGKIPLEILCFLNLIIPASGDHVAKVFSQYKRYTFPTYAKLGLEVAQEVTEVDMKQLMRYIAFWLGVAANHLVLSVGRAEEGDLKICMGRKKIIYGIKL